jgi:hypothetical protein
LVAVAPFVGCYAALLGVYDLASHPVLLLAISAAAFGALAFAHRRLRGQVWGVRTLLGVALLVRVLVLPLPLTLSDDAYRYLWDGRVALAGHDPYELAPDAVELASLRDGLWQRVGHKDVPTVYPPAAVGLFSIAAALPASVYALKSSLALLDLAGCALLWLLARRTGVPRERVLWYAWNPLVVLEGAGMGHVDVAGAAVAIAAVALLCGSGPESRRRTQSAAAGVFAAAGVLLKLVPLVALPGWFRHARRRWVFAVAAALVIAVGLLPMFARPGIVPPGLVRYGVSWEFNGPLFEPLWRSLEAIEAAPRVKHLLDRVKDQGYRLGRDPSALDELYPFVYPQFLAKAALAVLMSAAVAFSIAARDPVTASLRAFGGALVLHATVYPWYAIWTLPWAALRGAWPWQVLSFTLLFSYLPRTLGLTLFPWVYALVWGPFAIAVAAAWWRGRGGDRSR